LRFAISTKEHNHFLRQEFSFESGHGNLNIEPD